MPLLHHKDRGQFVKKLRILMLHEDRRRPGEGGGAESLLRDQTQALQKLGHSVKWWQGDVPLQDCVTEYMPDVCHIMTIHNFIGLRPALWLQQNKIPHVWSLMDYWPFCGGRMLLTDGDRSCAAVEGVCDGNCDGHPAPARFREIVNGSPVLALNRHSAAIYERHGIPVYAVTPLGVDTERFQPDYARRNGARVMTTTAWPGWPTKGMHILREALRKVGVGAKLVTGVSRERVRDELQTASIFVFPSTYQETWGLCLTEAMACGCACIASAVAGPKQQIEDGIDGLLVPPRDADALADALQRLLDDDERRERLGKAARAKAEREFTLERMGRTLVETYRSVINGS